MCLLHILYQLFSPCHFACSLQPVHQFLNRFLSNELTDEVKLHLQASTVSTGYMPNPAMQKKKL